jgi:glucose-6-phosphate-specific signal transduction histidine kinase
MTGTDETKSTTDHWARRMLDSEQQSMVKLLHDDLGQNLVAIKSFAAAIVEQHGDADGDTGELAGMIREAAEAAYRSSYDLMQELRAQDHADRQLGEALELCLQEARLKENGIDYQCRVDPAVGPLDRETRALILRNVRAFANFCKSLQACENLSLDLRAGAENRDSALELTLVQAGEFDYLNRENFTLVSIAERMSAIGGEISLEASDDRKRITLRLCFDLLQAGGGIADD